MPLLAKVCTRQFRQRRMLCPAPMAKCQSCSPTVRPTAHLQLTHSTCAVLISSTASFHRPQITPADNTRSSHAQPQLLLQMQAATAATRAHARWWTSFHDVGCCGICARCTHAASPSLCLEDVLHHALLDPGSSLVQLSQLASREAPAQRAQVLLGLGQVLGTWGWTGRELRVAARLLRVRMCVTVRLPMRMPWLQAAAGAAAPVSPASADSSCCACRCHVLHRAGHSPGMGMVPLHMHQLSATWDMVLRRDWATARSTCAHAAAPLGRPAGALLHQASSSLRCCMRRNLETWQT
jgi:hypothetical protein